MNRLKLALMGVVVLFLVFFGVYALVDTDQLTSEVENRQLTQKPTFSWASLADGSYTEALATYYADQFPLRERFMAANRTMNQFYYYTDDDNTLIISFDGADAVQGGNAVVTDDEQTTAATSSSEVTQTVTVQAPTGDEPEAEPEPETDDDVPEEEAEPETEPEEDEDTHTYPSEDDAFSPTDSSILIVGDRAMDLPFASYDIIDLYADSVNLIASTLGEQVRTISLVTPNAGAFYSPESFHTGNYSQKDMIDYCYSKLRGIITVDAYGTLYDHTDDYIYFRTDHHWTALGAYYAYTAFCQAAGFTPVDLSEFETGRYDEFVGTMYTYTSSYPQSQALLDNPDYVDYYLPIVEAHAKYYTDASLSDGVAINVVSTHLTTSNKYLCFISGDTPICEITTDVTGPTCVVLKDSYGNAMVPFLTSHYSKIYVIDPREFNADEKPELDLTAFVAENDVDDVLIINYPFMINNKYYTKLLNHLVTDPDTWYE